MHPNHVQENEIKNNRLNICLSVDLFFRFRISISIIRIHQIVNKNVTGCLDLSLFASPRPCTLLSSRKLKSCRWSTSRGCPCRFLLILAVQQQFSFRFIFLKRLPTHLNFKKLSNWLYTTLTFKYNSLTSQSISFLFFSFNCKPKFHDCNACP